MQPLILIVEDDERLRRQLTRAFVDRGFDVREAANVDDALVAAAVEPPEFVVIDLRMPGRSGLDAIAHLKRLEPAMRIVVLTGYGSIATALEAVRLGATHYLTKPADADQILAAFHRGQSEPPQELELRPMSLDRVEWEHINRVLLECGGNISEAARVLGLHRRSLQRKLSKYPLGR